MTIYDKAREHNPPEIPNTVKVLLARFFTTQHETPTLVPDTAEQLDSIQDKLKPMKTFSEDEVDDEEEKKKCSTDESDICLGGNHEFDAVMEEIKYAAKTHEWWNKRAVLRRDWHTLGCMLDRMYFWVFLAAVIFSCAAIAVIVLVAKANFVDPEHHEHEMVLNETAPDYSWSYCQSKHK